MVQKDVISLVVPFAMVHSRTVGEHEGISDGVEADVTQRRHDSAPKHHANGGLHRVRR